MTSWRASCALAAPASPKAKASPKAMRLLGFMKILRDVSALPLPVVERSGELPKRSVPERRSGRDDDLPRRLAALEHADRLGDARQRVGRVDARPEASLGHPLQHFRHVGAMARRVALHRLA